MENYVIYRLLLVVVILALNAFFAAAEVSLVSSRRYRLRAMADEGTAGAQAALNLLANPERLLSVTQVGVTLASLGLGWAGEDTLFGIIQAVFHPIVTPAIAGVLHWLSFGIAFLGMSYAHVVVGEVVPKNLAIERAERLAVLVAPLLLVFYRLSAPFVFVAERTASALSRLLGLSGEPHGGGHSSEELKLLVKSSRSAGHLEAFEETAIRRLLDLRDVSVREVMVPRNSIVSIHADADLDEVLRLMSEQEYSRVPVWQDRPENIVGILHYRDLIREWETRRRSTEHRRSVPKFRLLRLLHKPLVIPETKPLSQLVDEFRSTHSHMALVVDEFGTIVGMATLEDVLEQVFGEIEDEHDPRRGPIPIGADVMELDGLLSVRDLEMHYGIELPADAGFETLAGFLLYRLGVIPKPGDSVVEDGRRYTVTRMDHNRIAAVRVTKEPAGGNTT